MNTKQLDKEGLQGQPPRSEHLTTADLARAADPSKSQRDAGTAAAVSEQGEDAAPPLFPSEVLDEFGSRWTEIQAGFVDTPREAVERADELVADAMKRLAESFAEERAQLEDQWSRNGDVSTEDLRIVLQRYRSFFQRLLHL